MDWCMARHLNWAKTPTPRALSEHSDVGLVELLTRKIEDPVLSPAYAVNVEPFVPEGPDTQVAFRPKRYIRKELLWNHLDSLVDRILWHFRRKGRTPDVIHTHYADAGYVGLEVSRMIGIPLLHTGHTLGRPKRAGLLESGMREEAIERQFHISRRIEAEGRMLRNAALIIASTWQEMDQQYGSYEGGRHNRFAVVPPGIDARRFNPPDREWTSCLIQPQVDRFLAEPGKSRIYGFRKYVTNLERDETRRYLDMSWGAPPEAVAGSPHQSRKHPPADVKGTTPRASSGDSLSPFLAATTNKLQALPTGGLRKTERE